MCEAICTQLAHILFPSSGIPTTDDWKYKYKLKIKHFCCIICVINLNLKYLEYLFIFKTIQNFFFFSKKIWMANSFIKLKLENKILEGKKSGIVIWKIVWVHCVYVSLRVTAFFSAVGRAIRNSAALENSPLITHETHFHHFHEFFIPPLLAWSRICWKNVYVGETQTCEWNSEKTKLPFLKEKTAVFSYSWELS